jgi:hypothetical protein
MTVARMAVALALVVVAGFLGYHGISYGWQGGESSLVRFELLPVLALLGAAWAVWPRA